MININHESCLRIVDTDFYKELRFHPEIGCKIECVSKAYKEKSRSIFMNPDEVRTLANWLLSRADEMEKKGQSK